MDEVRAYMAAHPSSELHRRGKMFGVLVVDSEQGQSYLKAFSAMLDGSYEHPGFVPPVYACDIYDEACRGTDADDSRRKQQWIFSQYRFLNALGEEKNLIDIFRDVPPVLSMEEYFAPTMRPRRASDLVRIPSGAGECCAPKLLQEAFRLGLRPVCLAEFWMGAAPQDELRIEGQFYPACSGKCRPILSHMLSGLEVAPSEEWTDAAALAEKTTILYEDDYLLALNKPSGLLSVPGKDGKYSLLEYLTSHQPEGRSPLTFYPVHRLDQDTSGILIVAKQAEVAKQLQSLFLRRDIHKLYWAELEPESSRQLVVGQQGTISLPLLPNPMDRPRQMVNHEHGKPAITHYQVSDQLGPHGGRVVFLRPETGRTHQLRVHCAHPQGLAAPIYGDRLYGSPLSANSASPDSRLMLHAAQITFPHPVSGTLLTIDAPFV